jgi:diacylglycerol O-acyltransferase
MPPTPSPTNRMSTLDTEFFFAEHANTPLHMGSVAVFDGPAPEHRELTRLFAAKLSRVPRYRQVVSTVPGQILPPVWADDEHFQIRHHVRHVTVPAPGGDEQLRAVAAKIFARRLDLKRPLWEEWLLTGLADGRWAILSKIHHCMADGIGGNDLMTLVFDADPELNHINKTKKKTNNNKNKSTKPRKSVKKYK